MHTTLKAARRSLSRDSMASKGKKECSGELCTCTVLAVELRQFLHSVTSIPATCISKACDLNIRRGLKCVAAGKQYFPRWEKGKGQQKVNCCVPCCNLDVHVIKHQFSR